MIKNGFRGFEEIARTDNIDQNPDNVGNNAILSDITKAVDNISDKINLLALNTAIENTRTGAKESGLAEISAQVSKLAEHVSGAVKDIADIVKDVQTDIESTNGRIDDSKKNLDLQKMLAHKIMISLSEIFESIEKSQEIINQFTTTPGETPAAVGNESGANDRKSPGISISAGQKTTQELYHHVDELRSLVNSFKL